MKPTVVAPVPGPLAPAGEVQAPLLAAAVVVEPEAGAAVVLDDVEVEDLPQAVAAKATTPIKATALATVVPARPFRVVRDRDMWLRPP
jgi:hypothetical protein